AEYMMIAFESSNTLVLESLAALQDAVTRIEALQEVKSVISPFNLITFQKDGKRLQIMPMSPGNRAPKNDEELEKFKDRLLKDPFAKKMVISEDGTVLSVVMSMLTVADPLNFMDRLDAALLGLDDYYTVHVTGAPALGKGVQTYLTRDLSKLILLAVGIILVIYFLSFRAYRAPILALAVVGIGTVWSLGAMSLLGFSITVVSSVTPTLVLTLGSSYSIHIFNQYYRDAVCHEADDVKSKQWIADAVVNIGRTILLAAGTTVIGFLSLLATELKATREFGIATSIGIASSALLSFFFLPAVLSRLKSPSMRQKEKVLEGAITRLMARISDFVLNKRYIVFILLGLIVIAFGLLFNRVHYKTEVISYFPQRDKIIKDTRFIMDKIGGYQQFNFTIVDTQNRPNYFLEREVLEKLSLFENKIKTYDNVSKVISFVSYLEHLNNVMFNIRGIPENKGLILLLSRYIKTIIAQPDVDDTIRLMANEDFSMLNISIWVYDQEKKSLLADEKLKVFLKNLNQDAAAILGDDMKTALWGESLTFISLSDVIQRDQRLSTLLSALFIFIITSISFKSLRFGLFSLIPLLVGIMVNFVFMVIAGIPMDMTTVMFSIVVIGVGVDNSIHFLIQFNRQKKLHPGDIRIIVFNSLKISGRPILITTASVVAGFLVLCFSSFLPILYFGILVAMALFTAAFGTLIVLPAVLTIGWLKRSG
ncbi:MAG: hypothetical protein E4H36_11670, partial [Spirochaetales bacterium]